jgi:homoserine/homoserine lactone efflux protein
MSAQASILGILAANALYCALAVLGLGAVILAAPSLFEIITWCGVASLAWLGLKALRAARRSGPPLAASVLRARPLALFRQSFVLQGASPGSVLYFCTLLPVFAGAAEGAPARIALLGPGAGERLVHRRRGPARARRAVGRRVAGGGGQRRRHDAAQPLTRR